MQVLVVRRGPLLGAASPASSAAPASPSSSDRVSVAYGGVTVASGGVGIDHDADAVAAHMAGRHLEHRRPTSGSAAGAAHVLTNDLTHAYIDENMGTS